MMQMKAMHFLKQPKEQIWSCRFFLVLSMDYSSVRQLV